MWKRSSQLSASSQIILQTTAVTDGTAKRVLFLHRLHHRAVVSTRNSRASKSTESSSCCRRLMRFVPTQPSRKFSEVSQMLIRHLWDILLLFLNIFGILLSNLFSLFKPLKLNHLDTFATDCTCRGEHKRTRMHCRFYSHYYKYTVKDFTISLSTALH